VRIAIDTSAANHPDAHQWLDRILYRIEDGWHVWDVDDVVDPDVFGATSWIGDRDTQGDWVRELLVASIQRGAWSLSPHGRHVRVTTHPAATDELAPEHAFRLADEPLVILVENQWSDGAFVERVVKELDKSLCALWGRGGNPIRFDSVGGLGQMPAAVIARTDGLPYRPRLVTVADSDRKGPGDTESREARALRRVCEERGLSCWVLAKREAENYLPRMLLDGRQDADVRHQQRVEAWDGLSDDQKDYFDMKGGLPERPSDIERNLFDGLPEAEHEILTGGFGDRVHQCWTLWQVRGIRDELLARGRGDLEHGIGLIRKEA
jgi:hypothetical protein